MRRFWQWLICSISNPHNLPHWLAAIFTFALAVFAWRAWQESQQTTQALRGQLEALRAEERPFLWIAQINNPLFFKVSNQITDTFFYANYGKGIAYNIYMLDYIKVGATGTFQISNGLNESAKIPNTTGLQSPPGKVNFNTVISRPGFSQEYFNTLITTDEAVGIKVVFYYSDAVNDQRYVTAVCEARLATHAWTYLDPEKCH